MTQTLLFTSFQWFVGAGQRPAAQASCETLGASLSPWLKGGNVISKLPRMRAVKFPEKYDFGLILDDKAFNLPPNELRCARMVISSSVPRDPAGS
ncbi:hypothetical protein F5X99DRAFT_408526 [Biscogniauxia marginata]|nr:hypothetical protein F5X99DRAFT_408526 [Biscogniauxia marginata]